LVYWFLKHVLGEKGTISGVQMHMGHFFKHTRVAVPGLNGDSRPENNGFSPKGWQKFIQSAVCNWLQSIPDKNTQCCAHHKIGGDGTGIGAIVENCDVQELWRPPGGTRVHTNDDRRRDRCCLLFDNTEITKKDAQEFRKTLTSFFQAGLTASAFSTLAMSVQAMRDILPDALRPEILRCTSRESMPVTEFNKVRSVLKAMVSEVTVTAMVLRKHLPGVSNFLQVLRESTEITIRKIAFVNWVKSRPRGLLWEFSEILELQLHQGAFRASTIQAMEHLGKEYCFFLIQFLKCNTWTLY